MLANENHVYWLLMQVCQSNIFFHYFIVIIIQFLLYCGLLLHLLKMLLGKYVGGGYGPSPTFKFKSSKISMTFWSKELGGF